MTPRFSDWYRAGFTGIIPVIPPEASLSPSSKIRPEDRGKAPGRLNVYGQWAGFDWRNHQTTESECRMWTETRASIGLRAMTTPGLDIDVLHAEIAEFITEVAHRVLGPAPRRIGRAPKRLLAYRTDQPFGRKRLRFTIPGSSEKHLVEMLGSGQQYVVEGRHPGTKKPYTWDRDPVRTGPAGLTKITEERADAFFTEVIQLLITLWGCEIIEYESSSVEPPPKQDALKGDIDLVEAAVRRIPNDYPDRDDYIRMGCAIKAACAADEGRGLEIFQEWCSRWTDGANDPETVACNWEGLRPPFRVGADYLFRLAQRRGGFNYAGEEFSDVCDPPPPEGAAQANSAQDKVRSKYIRARKAIALMDLECWHDLSKDRLLVNGEILTDNMALLIRDRILDMYKTDVGLNAAREALATVCLKQPRDPLRRYLDDLVWDGVPRINRWLTTYASAVDTELTQTVGAIFLIAAVRRVRRPGTKFDQMLVLEGPQGTGKSTLMKVIAGGDHYFSDQNVLAVPDKEHVQQLSQFWFHEFAELEALGKVDIARLKAFLSRTTDRGRPAYGRFQVEVSRRCVFVGTTNDHDVGYLRDDTGDRRFWPVLTGEIDLVGAARDRDQLWAEAAAREAQGESIELPRKLWALIAGEQEARRTVDPWVELLLHVQYRDFSRKVTDEEGKEVWRVTTADLFRALNLPGGQANTTHARRLARAMRRLGWEGPKKLRIADKTFQGYFRPYTTPEGDQEFIDLADISDGNSTRH